MRSKYNFNKNEKSTDSAIFKYSDNRSKYKSTVDNDICIFDLNADGSEADMHQNVFDEAVQHYGWEVLYMPRTFVNVDEILGEDLYSIFQGKDAFPLRLYLNEGQYFGEHEIFARSSIRVDDTATFQVVRDRFAHEANKYTGAIDLVPKEGDTFQIKSNKHIFQINFVEPEAQFWDRGRAFVYEFKAVKYTVGGEQFDIGDSNIDNIPNLTEEKPELVDNVKVEEYTKDQDDPIFDQTEKSYWDDL